MTKKYAWCKGFIEGYENEAEKHHVYEKYFKLGIKDEYKQYAYDNGKDYESSHLFKKRRHQNFMLANYPIVCLPNGDWFELGHSMRD